MSTLAAWPPEGRAAAGAGVEREAERRPTPPLILASGSPRRAELLRMLGLSFEVVVPRVDESWREGEPAALYAERLAREKAEAVAAIRPDGLVIACDTIVVLDGEILGKPRDEADAVRMLMRLAGREHRVETGIAVVAPGGRIESSVEGARVRFRPFDRTTAEEYVATGEPLDKAGAYGIQGLGAALVDLIDGDFFAVVGLPVSRMISLLRALGWRYNFRGLEPLEP
jgi:septum formation protein